MEKIKRSLALCGIAVAFCLGSCISTTDELDLDKEISLDMQIGPGGLTIPLGSLSRIYLDSLINTGDDSVLDTLDGGLFGFTMGDSIDKVSVSIDQVSINVDDFSINPMETKFENADVKDVEIPNKVNTSTVRIDKIDLSDLKLPSFSSSTQTDDKEVTGSGSPEKITLPAINISDNMDCKFVYDPFPSDLKKLNKIMFGEAGTTTGQKLHLNVDLSGVFAVLNNPEILVSELTITFPEKFVVAKDPALSTYISDSYVTASNNVFSIKMTSGYVQGISAENSTLPVSFFLKEGDFSEYDEGKIEFDKKITYDVELVIAGQPAAAGTQNFKVKVTMEEQLEMADIDAETEAKKIELDADTISSSCVVAGLDGVAKVDKITFNADNSFLYLTLSDLGLDPYFGLKSGSSDIVLKFPDEYEFDETYCKDENGATVGSWDGSTLTLEADKAVGATVGLKVKSLLVNEQVDKETASITIVTDVIYNGTVWVDNAEHVNLAALDLLTDKTLNVAVKGKFEVANAEVDIAEMRTEFENHTDISIKEKVDDQLVMIKRIDLADASDVELKLKFEGVPEAIKELTFSRFTIEFPDFMTIEYQGTDNSRIKTSGNKLIINGNITDDELHTEDGFVVSGLKITDLSFTTPVEIKNGFLELKDQKVNISGAVTVKEQEGLNQSDLDVIIVDPSVSFSTMVVKSIYGKVNPSITGVHEAVALPLGDDMSFFKDEKNNLSLSDPQIMLNLKSSVTVPIDLDLKLSSKNSKGEYIKKDMAPDKGIIHLLKCDSLQDSRNTTLVFCKTEKAESVTGDTLYVVMSDLSDLISTVPDTIIFDLKASVDQSVDHFVDLSRDLAVSGDYKVTIPLSFDSLYIEYNDTIKDLGKDLEDIADMIEGANLQILADVVSTIPLGISLSAKAYDVNWEEVPGIEISTFSINPGSESGTKSEMVLGLNVKSGSLAKLESLILTAACQSGEGASSIRKGQWLEITKMRLKLPEGLKIDLTDNEKGDKK